MTLPILLGSVSDTYHFDADPDPDPDPDPNPDPRICFLDDGSGSGSGSGSNKFQFFFLLNFFCIRFKTHNDVFFCCIFELITIFFGTRIQINVS